MKKLISVLLLLAMLVLPLASCGGNKGTETETTAAESTATAESEQTEETTTAETTVDDDLKWEEIASRLSLESCEQCVCRCWSYAIIRGLSPFLSREGADHFPSGAKNALPTL